MKKQFSRGSLLEAGIHGLTEPLSPCGCRVLLLAGVKVSSLHPCVCVCIHICVCLYDDVGPGSRK